MVKMLHSEKWKMYKQAGTNVGEILHSEKRKMYRLASANAEEILHRRKKGRSHDPTLGLQFVQSNQPFPHSCVKISLKIFTNVYENNLN